MSEVQKTKEHLVFISHRSADKAIADAICQGDSVGARCAMIMHLTYNRQMLMKLMEESGR